jgi:hypothetical protein
MPEQNIESKNTARKLTLDELTAVSGGDGPAPIAFPPIIIVSPGPGDNPMGGN